MDEEAVLGEEACEQQAVPLLVGALGDEQVEVVRLVPELVATWLAARGGVSLVLAEMRRRAVVQ